MPIVPISNGTYPNDNTGTALQTAFNTVNSNFTAVAGGQRVLSAVYTFATLPSAVLNPYMFAATSDAGAYFSNGTTWVSI